MPFLLLKWLYRPVICLLLLLLKIELDSIKFILYTSLISTICHLHFNRYKLGLKQKKAKLSSGEKKEARRVKKATKADEDGEDGEGRAYILFIYLYFVE